MPAIRSVLCEKNVLKIEGLDKTYTFDISKIPVGKDTIPKLESYLNAVWIPSLNLTDCQVEVHVISVSPLVITSYITELGNVIPQNWWIQE